MASGKTKVTNYSIIWVKLKHFRFSFQELNSNLVQIFKYCKYLSSSSMLRQISSFSWSRVYYLCSQKLLNSRFSSCTNVFSDFSDKVIVATFTVFSNVPVSTELWTSSVFGWWPCRTSWRWAGGGGGTEGGEVTDEIAWTEAGAEIEEEEEQDKQNETEDAALLKYVGRL